MTRYYRIDPSMPDKMPVWNKLYCSQCLHNGKLQELKSTNLGVSCENHEYVHWWLRGLWLLDAARAMGVDIPPECFPAEYPEHYWF